MHFFTYYNFTYRYLNGRPSLTVVGSNNRDDSNNRSPDPLTWCDSSSEVSDEGYKSQGPPRPPPRSRKGSPKKVVETLDSLGKSYFDTYSNLNIF